MKVLIINGSPRANGNTDIALREMEKVFAEEGVEIFFTQMDVAGAGFNRDCKRVWRRSG